MKYAIIEAGGKQYVARERETVEVDRLPLGIGDKVTWKEVLLLVDNSQTIVGHPYILGASVEGRVVAQIKAKKILVFKYIPKERYRRRKGHRQQYTRVLIDRIGGAPAKKVVEASLEADASVPMQEAASQAAEVAPVAESREASPAPAKAKRGKASPVAAKEKASKARQTAAKEKSGKASPAAAKAKDGSATKLREKKPKAADSKAQKSGGDKKPSSQKSKPSAKAPKK